MKSKAQIKRTLIIASQNTHNESNYHHLRILYFRLCAKFLKHLLHATNLNGSLLEFYFASEFPTKYIAITTTSMKGFILELFSRHARVENISETDTGYIVRYATPTIAAMVLLNNYDRIVTDPTTNQVCCYFFFFVCVYFKI